MIFLRFQSVRLKRMNPVPKRLVVQILVNKGFILVILGVSFGVLILQFVATIGMDVVLVEVV